MVEESGEVQKPGTEPQEPAEDVQGPDETATATPAVEESKQSRTQDGELLPTTELTHHLDALL